MCDYTISRRQRRSDKETAFVEIIVKNFPNVIKSLISQIHNTQQYPNRINANKKLSFIIVSC